MVLFGGAPALNGQGWYNDTWIWKGTGGLAGTWTAGPAAPAGLTPRGGMAMAWDPAIGKVVMFGGAGPSDWPPRNETWLFDGTAWTLGAAPPAGLTGRTGAQMVYDDALGKVVLNGPFGTVSLDKNRQAVEDEWSYQIVAKPGQTLVKTVQWIPKVNQTFGGTFASSKPPTSRSFPPCTKRALPWSGKERPVVNGVINPEAGEEQPEFVRNRIEMQAGYLGQIRDQFDGDVRAVLPLYDSDIRGVAMLDRAGAALFG